MQTLPALMSKGTIFLTAVNNTDIDWKIEKSQMMGSLDCRSLGYFHISRYSLQRIMLDNADFLTDKETRIFQYSKGRSQECDEVCTGSSAEEATRDDY